MTLTLSLVNSTKRRSVTPVTKPRALTLKPIGYTVPTLHVYSDLLATATFDNQLNYRIINKMLMLLRVPKHLSNSTIYNHGALLTKWSSSKKTYSSKECTVVLYNRNAINTMPDYSMIDERKEILPALF